MRAAIEATGEVVRVNRRADGVRLVQHGLGKMQRQIVLAQHGKHVHAFRIRRAEDFDNLAFRIRVARFPFAQFDDHFVPCPCRPAHVARWRHINIVRNARIIGNDVEKLPALLQRADNLRAPAFQNADDRAGVRFVFAKIFPAHLAAHQHAVFVQRRAGGAFGNGDFLETRIVRLEKTFARAVHADAAGNQVGFAWADVTIALDARDRAGLLQLAQHGLQLLLVRRRQAKQPEQFRHIRRNIIFLLQPPDDLLSHDD